MVPSMIAFVMVVVVCSPIPSQPAFHFSEAALTKAVPFGLFTTKGAKNCLILSVIAVCADVVDVATSSARFTVAVLLCCLIK